MKEHFSEWLDYVPEMDVPQSLWFFGDESAIPKLLRALYLAGYSCEEARNLLTQLFSQPPQQKPTNMEAITRLGYPPRLPGQSPAKDSA